MLQIGALVFFISGNVATAGRGRAVFLTLQILGYDITQERDAAGILEDLQVTPHLILRHAQGFTVRFELYVAQNINSVNSSAAALFDLDVATYDRSGVDEDRPGTFSLDVAVDTHPTGAEGRPGRNFQGSFEARAIQRAGTPVRHEDVIEGHGAYCAGAHPLFGERDGCCSEHGREGQAGHRRDSSELSHSCSPLLVFSHVVGEGVAPIGSARLKHL